MVVLSIIRSLDILMSSARVNCPLILNTDSSVGEGGALMWLWKVQPSVRRFAAMPVVAMARPTQPPGSRLLTAASTAFITYVLPQPPLAFMKTCSGELLLTASRMVSNTWCCCSVNHPYLSLASSFRLSVLKSSSSHIRTGRFPVITSTCLSSSSVGLESWASQRSFSHDCSRHCRSRSTIVLS